MRLLGLALVFACLVIAVDAAEEPSSAPDYILEELWLSQPVEHSDVDGEHFDQQIFILQPNTALSDAKVFFILGNEADASMESLIHSYQIYGEPENVVFILAEHRGYGQSITQSEQSRPSYVRVNQALKDYHHVVRHLKKRFSGQWIAAGYSYGGALVVNFAYDFPGDVDVILASSAPIYWPFQVEQYSVQARENLGADFADRLYQHALNLKPEAAFDDLWYKRELLTTVVVGLSQIESQQDLKSSLAALSYLPTFIFMPILKMLLPQASFDWVAGREMQTLSHEKALTGRYNWHTWKYQQCRELGAFFIDKPFAYTKQEHIEDCRQTFEKSPEYFASEPWPIAKMISEITLPQIHVVGGKDPWSLLGVQPDHQYQNIEYIYDAEGFHCPDSYKVDLGKRVMTTLLDKLAYEESVH